MTNAQDPVPTDNPVMSAIPWYQSSVVVAQVSAALSACISILPKSSLIAALGVVDPHTVSDDVAAIFSAIAVVMSVVSVIKRTQSAVQPVTLTKIGADMHANTLAVAQAKANSQAGTPTPAKK